MQLASLRDPSSAGGVRSTPIVDPSSDRDAKGPVLLIEDDPWNRQVLELGFAGEGYSVVSAASGREALAKSAGGVPPLVVLDLRLPDLSAAEVVAGLRDLGAFRLVLVSALPDLDTWASTLGAVAAFPKPYDLGELLDRAQGLIAAERATRP